ncbi:MAG TPA: GNAT family N-acetyltransferase, partial [bacterium]|nr:GNAT family N-acetyltransferase [bacterium]
MTGETEAVYPADRETDAVLRDGTAIRIRPVRPDDEPRLSAFLVALSPDSRALRFFGTTSDDAVVAYARRAVQVDYDRHFGLVAVTGVDGRIVGHAAYQTTKAGSAEASFTVADDYQGRCLGTMLLGHLCEIAVMHGIGLFEALVLPHNAQMLQVFRESGLPIGIRFTGSELTVTFPTALTQDALDRFYRRDQIAAEHALRAFFAPIGVAVIGASRRRGTIGGEIFHNLLDYGLRVPVYPVNPAAATVQEVPAYRTVEEIPGPVDLAIIAVPAADVL